MDEQTEVLRLRPLFGALDSAEITAPRRAGALRRWSRRMSCYLWDRYARVHVDVLVAGSDYCANYLMGALARQAGLSVALYHHPDDSWVAGMGWSAHREGWYSDSESVQQLSKHLKVDTQADSVEQVLKAFYSRVGRVCPETSLTRPVLNLIGNHLVPDNGESIGLPGGEVFWPVRPMQHASVDSEQTVVAMRMPELPMVRFGRGGRSFVTACQCVMTTPIPGFSPHSMRCAAYNLSRRELDTMLAVAGAMAHSVQPRRNGARARGDALAQFAAGWK
jgi:hypothetical protein